MKTYERMLYSREVRRMKQRVHDLERQLHYAERTLDKQRQHIALLTDQAVEMLKQRNEWRFESQRLQLKYRTREQTDA